MLFRNRVFLSLTIAALLSAGPASANGNHWRRHHHKHHHRHHHGCGHGGYYAPRYVEHQYRGYPVYHHGQGPRSYYCGPCSHHFDSYDDLSYHVHQHHSIAVLQLPFVLFEASIGGGVGWVYDH